MAKMLRTLLAALAGAFAALFLRRRREPPPDAPRAEVDPDRIKWLALTGTLPYTKRELVARRERIGQQMGAVLAEADRLGISHETLFQPARGGGPTPIVAFRDTGTMGEEGPAAAGGTGGATTPCCTPAQIAAGLVAIRAAYTAAVAGVSKWKGCQDWSTIVQSAVAPVLPPCWSGKFVWRIKVYPFGRFFPGGDGDTFVHHAYAVCPCTCPSFGGCSDCLVLDPYTITGFALFQSADTYPFSDWTGAGNVWRATSLPHHDNGTIYAYTMRHYCAQARLGPVQRGTCRIVRELLKRELRRYTGATGPVLDSLYRQYGLDPDCC